MNDWESIGFLDGYCSCPSHRVHWWTRHRSVACWPESICGSLAAVVVGHHRLRHHLRTCDTFRLQKPFVSKRNSRGRQCKNSARCRHRALENSSRLSVHRGVAVIRYSGKLTCSFLVRRNVLVDWESGRQKQSIEYRRHDRMKNSTWMYLMAKFRTWRLVTFRSRWHGTSALRLSKQSFRWARLEEKNTTIVNQMCSFRRSDRNPSTFALLSTKPSERKFVLAGIKFLSHSSCRQVKKQKPMEPSLDLFAEIFSSHSHRFGFLVREGLGRVERLLTNRWRYLPMLFQSIVDLSIAKTRGLCARTEEENRISVSSEANRTGWMCHCSLRCSGYWCLDRRRRRHRHRRFGPRRNVVVLTLDDWSDAHSD